MVVRGVKCCTGDCGVSEMLRYWIVGIRLGIVC